MSRTGFRTRLFLIVGAALLLVGCANEAPAGDDRAVEPGVMGAAVLELGIGSADGEEPYLFGSIEDVAAAPNGTIYVADSRLTELRAYDPEGRFLRTIGARGQGPGEFESLVNVEVLSDGRIAVLADAGQVIVYDAAGNYLSDFRVESLSFRSQGRFRMESGGEDDLIFPAYDAELEGEVESWQRGRSPTHLARYSAEGELLGTYPVPPANISHQGWVMPRPEGVLEPFIVKTLNAWSPLGYPVHGRNDEYTIRAGTDEDGEPILLRRRLPPAELAPDEREFWLGIVASMRERYAGYPEEALGSMQRPEDSWIPENKPYFRVLHVDADGRMWVHRYVEAELWDPPPPPPAWSDMVFAWREPPTYDVWSPGGELLGTVVLPRLTKFTQIDGDTMWGIHETLDGFQQAVRMRITPPLGSEATDS